MEQQKLQRLVEEISINKFKLVFMHRAYFNPRLKTTGGRYLLQSHNIELNERLYKHFGIEELEGIILHELCHYHLHLQGKGYKHRDRDFRDLLKEVGAPRFCSRIDEVKKHRVTHFYKCQQCNQEYLRQRKMDESKYRCGKCNGKIKFIKSKKS